MSLFKKSPARPRRWRRRFLWLLALVVVARVALGFAVGPILRKVAAGYGIELDYEELEIAIIEGRLELWRLNAVVEDQAGGTRPLVALQTLAIDIDTSALWRGRLIARRVELDGMRVDLTRDADGNWNLDPVLARLLSDEGIDEAEDEIPEPDEPDEDEPGPIVLNPPIEIIATRVRDLTLHLRDDLVSPPLDATLTVSLTANDIGSPGKSTYLDIVGTSPELLDVFRVRGSGEAQGAHGDLRLDVEVANMRLGPVAHLLAPLGLEPIAERIDAGVAIELEVRPTSETEESLEASFVLQGAHLTEDGREALALDSLSIDVTEASSRGVHVRQVLVDGLRGRAERLPDGGLALAGIAWRGTSASEPETREEVATLPEESESSRTASAKPFDWSLEELRVQGGHLLFDDRALVPTVELGAELEQLTLGPLSSVADAPAARLEIISAVPGVIQKAQLSGELSLFAEPPTLELAVEAGGISPKRIAPYLAMAGIESDFESGAFKIESIAIGATEGGGQEFQIRDLALQDGERNLGSIGRIALRLEEDEAPRIELGGARLELTRESTGAISLVGLRFGASPPPPVYVQSSTKVQVQEAPTKATAVAFSLPTIELPSASLEFEELVLIDAATGSEPLALGPFTADLGLAELLEGEERAYQVQLDGRTVLASKLEARLRLAQATTGALALSGNAHARGVEMERLRPWLSLVNLEPALAAGSLDAEFDLRVEAIEGQPVIDLEVGPLHLSQGSGAEQREWLGLERLAVERLVVGDEIAITSVRIDSPRIMFQRDADGGLVVPGLRLPPPTAAESAPTTTQPKNGTEAPVEVAVESAAGPVAGFFRLGVLELSGAQVLFEDLAQTPRHPLELGCDLTIEDLAPGIGAGPCSLTNQVSLGTWQFVSSGDLVLDPNNLRASLELTGSGLSGDPLLPYLPPTLAVELRDGLVAGKLDASVIVAEEGGHGLSMRVTEVDLRERGAERAIAALSEVRVEVSRLDPVARVLNIDELVVAGTSLDVVRTAEGGVSAFGFRVTPQPQTAEAQEGEPTTPAPTTPGPRTSPTEPTPELRIGSLDLELAELRVTNEAYADRVASISTARLSLREPYELVIDPDTEDVDPPAIGLDLVASLSPGIEQLDAALNLAPFSDPPRLEAKLAVRGISGDGILALAPELSADLDPTELTDGTFDGSLELELDLRRRSRFEFDLSNGFGAELQIRDVALRQAPDAEVALGVDFVEVVAQRIVPRTGLVDLERIEIDTPRARVRRSAEGLELAGLVIRLPEPEAAKSATPKTTPPVLAEEGGTGVDSTQQEPGVAREAAGNVNSAAEGAVERTDEFRMRNLLVNDIDVVFEDTRADPPLILPLTTLGVEVRGFTTRAFVEPIPIRVSAAVGAGPVPLPKRVDKVSMVSGLASGAMGLLSGSDEKIRYEERPFFEEAALTANITLNSQPKGWARLSVTSFELVGLRGLARQSGVEIGDGILDFNARVRLDGVEGGQVDSLTSLSFLSLSEPAGGPISRYLKLPAPLDTVLFALKNDQGEHRLPLSFDIEEGGGISTAHISTKASAALLGLITEALASAPLRAVGGVTDVIGLGGLFGSDDSGSKYAGLTATVNFPGAGARIGAAELAELDEICEAMHEDPLLEVRAIHVFGQEDIERAERLASPGSNEAATLLRGLRLSRDELLRRHDEQAAAARSQLLLGQNAEFEATQAVLVDINRELGLTEDGIDVVAELLRPGSERRRPRRTRKAALAIARTRMDALSRELLNSGVPYDRMDLRSPRYELPTAEDEQDAPGKIVLVTRGGTPPKGFFRKLLGWIGL